MSEGFADSLASSTRLLGANDPSPVSVRNVGGKSPLVILGDHAGCAVPESLHNLGLDRRTLTTHIALDIGVATLGLLLTQRLDATFIAQRYSRLVIDCNRDPSHPASILTESDGTVVPANQALDLTGQRARRLEVFEPYHARIDACLMQRRSNRRAPIIIALHSFTPVWNGERRPWGYGVLHLGQSSFSRSVLTGLRQRLGNDEVGDNEPYRMDATDYTVPRHAIAKGLDYLELEVRQDLLTFASGRQAVGAVLVAILEEALQALPGGDPLAPD